MKCIFTILFTIHKLKNACSEALEYLYNYADDKDIYDIYYIRNTAKFTNCFKNEVTNYVYTNGSGLHTPDNGKFFIVSDLYIMKIKLPISQNTC